MTLIEALNYCLDKTLEGRQVTKYRLSKICDVQPIMVDKWLTGKTKTIRREAAEQIMSTFNITIDDNYINGFQKKMFVNRFNELDH